MVTIPNRKADVVIRQECGRQYPALNVKVHGGLNWGAERIAKEFRVPLAQAERAGELAFESAQERFWNERALNALNFAMLDADRASEVKPAGLQPSPYNVMSAGRSGGWLIVEGLPPVDSWDAVQFGQWRKFARLIRDEIADLLAWEQIRDAIEANNWHQAGAELYNFIDRKDGTVACLSELKAAARAAGFAPVVRP